MKTLFKIFTIISLAFLSSCDLFDSDNDPKLPPITMEGNNTFGCLVNGSVWLPSGGFDIPPVSADYTSGTFISFRASSDNSGFLFLLFDPILINQSFSLADTSRARVYYDLEKNNSVCVYEDYHVVDGNLIITKFDLNKEIVSGTFEFSTYNPDCGDTVKIKEGRFDIGSISH